MRFVALLLAMIGLLAPLSAARAAGVEVSVDAALRNISAIVRSGEVGYAAAWHGNKYVQCRRLPGGEMGCEAAGTLLQPSMARVLSSDRVQRLGALGWTLEPAFGNYRQTFPSAMATEAIAARIVETLVDVYAADPSRIETMTEWVADLPCPPRTGFAQNLAGLVSDAPSMRSTAIIGCAYAPPPCSPDPQCTALPTAKLQADVPHVSFDAFAEAYLDGIAAEIQRLRVNADRPVFAVFNAEIGYVQCQPNARSAVIYCEAQSEESWPALAALLTTEKRAFLHDHGYVDPGYSPNYSTEYPLGTMDDAAIAREILKVFYEVYDLRDVTSLKVAVEAN